MADNHWEDLITALYRDAIGQTMPIPVFDYVQEGAS